MGDSLGSYELLRPLGKGGMGEVFLARRRGPGGIAKRLVVKRIRADRATDPRLVPLFLREARLSMGLVHANIVPVFDCGREGDELFLVMEYVEGRDLGTALRRARACAGPPLDPLLVAAVGSEVCAALDYAHGRRDEKGQPLGIVHRDVTPANILLSFSGEVKLVDFGLAALAGDPAGTVRGTPAYLAPEQARGEPVDARTDLFSVGLVLWEALTGRAAYDGADPVAAAREGQVEPIPDGLHPALARIVARATARRPDDRYPDAATMVRELERFTVAARAAAPTLAPPRQRLAAWLGAHYPEGAATDADEAAPAGSSRARSLAETAPATAPATSPRRWPWVAAALVAVSVLGLLGLRGVGATRRPPPPPRDAALAAVPAASDGGTAQPGPIALAPPDAAPAPRPPPRPVPPAPATLGRVEISARPWAQVRIGGRLRCPETPCQLALPAGPHTIELYNPIDRSARSVAIVVAAGATVVVATSLERR